MDYNTVKSNIAELESAARMLTLIRRKELLRTKLGAIRQESGEETAQICDDLCNVIDDVLRMKGYSYEQTIAEYNCALRALSTISNDAPCSQGSVATEPPAYVKTQEPTEYGWKTTLYAAITDKRPYTGIGDLSPEHFAEWENWSSKHFPQLPTKAAVSDKSNIIGCCLRLTNAAPIASNTDNYHKIAEFNVVCHKNGVPAINAMIGNQDMVGGKIVSATPQYCGYRHTPIGLQHTYSDNNIYYYLRLDGDAAPALCAVHPSFCH